MLRLTTSFCGSLLLVRILASLLLLSLATPGFTAPIIRIVETKITGPGHVPCKNNNGDDLPPEQFKLPVTPGTPDIYGTAQSFPTAAIRSSNITVSVTWFCPSNASGLTTGTISATSAQYAGITVPVDTSPKSFTISPGGFFTISWNVGALPNKVYPKATLSIGMTASWTASHGAVMLNYAQDLYLVCSTPVSPMVKPWLGVLDDSCTWAQDCTSTSDVRINLVTGLYYGGVFYYQGTSTFSPGYPNNSQFALQSFLAAARPALGNCYDVSNYLAICMAAHGISSSQLYLKLQGGGSFTTNSLLPIGWFLYTNATWTNHQIVYSNSSVYDSCLALEYDYLGSLWENPVWDWTLPQYWQNSVSSTYYGLVQTPAPAQRTIAGNQGVTVIDEMP